MEKEKSVIDRIFDENDNDPVVLYSNDMAIEFDQVAIISLDGGIYVMLAPITKIEGINDDEAFVFSIEENNEEESLSLITDSEILDKVFDEYYKLLERNNINY